MDIKFIESFDDSAAIKELERIESGMLAVGKASIETQKVFTGAMSDMEESAGAAAEATRKLADGTAGAASMVENLKKQNASWTANLKQTVLGIQIGNKSLGEWVQLGKNGVSAFANFAKSLITGANAAKVLRIALISTGIGAILVLIGSAVAYFGTFQKAIDKVKTVMAGLSGAVEAAKGHLTALGDVFKGVGRILTAPLSLFAGKNPFTEIKEGFQQAKAGALEFGAAVKEGFNVGSELETATQALRDFELANAVAANRRSIRAAKFQAQADDETRTIEDRMRLNKLAFDLEAQNDRLRIRAATEHARITMEQAKIGGITADEQAEINDAQIAADNARGEAAERRLKFQEKQNKLVDAEGEKAAKLQREYDKVLETIIKRTDELAAKNEGDPLDAIAAQREIALAAASALGEQLAQLSADAFAKADAEKAVTELFAAINQKYDDEVFVAEFKTAKLAEALTLELSAADARRNAEAARDFLISIAPDDAARKAVLKKYDAVFRDIDALLKERQKELADNKLELPGIDGNLEKKLAKEFSASVIAALERGGAESEKKVVDVTERILLKVAEVFKLRGKNVIDKKEAAAIFESLNGAFEDALDGFKLLSDAKIEGIDREIEALDKLIEASQTNLDEQKRLKEEGLANDFDVEKRKLAALEKQRQEADKKRLAEQRKVANIELALDAAKQASSLTTAAAKLLADGASKGLVGIITAIGAIAALFAIIAQARANAQKFAAPKLRKGMRLEGATHEEGGEPLHVGERRYEAERGEWLMGTEASREHDRALEAINAHRYRGIDLYAVAERARLGHSESPGASAPPRHERLETQQRREEAARNDRALVAAFASGTDKIVSAVNGRPLIYPWKDGYREKRKRGQVTETVTVQPGA